jgi:hypothetical protein
MSNDVIADTIERAFAEHSYPLSLDDAFRPPIAAHGHGVSPPSSRRGVLTAAATFAAVLAIGGVLLLATARGQNGSGNVSNPAGVASTAPAVASTQTTPSATASTTEAASDVPGAVTYPDHEATLIETPLVVQAIPSGPVPQFNTGVLGVEAPVVPFETLRLEQLVLEENEYPLAPDQPIVALGDRDGLLAFRIPVVDSGEVVMCDWGVGWTKWNIEPGGQPLPLGTCGSGEVATPDVTVKLRQGLGPWITEVFWSSLPSDASVVQITANETRQWQRPIDGVAVFIVETSSEPNIELVSYDSNGRELDRRSP